MLSICDKCKFYFDKGYDDGLTDGDDVGSFDEYPKGNFLSTCNKFYNMEEKFHHTLDMIG